MNILAISLEKRPAGRGIIASDADMSYLHGFPKGWFVSLHHNDLTIHAQVMDVCEDHEYLGQVTDLEGFLGPEVRLQIGSYLKFREQHIFECHRA